MNQATAPLNLNGDKCLLSTMQNSDRHRTPHLRRLYADWHLKNNTWPSKATAPIHVLRVIAKLLTGIHLSVLVLAICRRVDTKLSTNDGHKRAKAYIVAVFSPMQAIPIPFAWTK